MRRALRISAFFILFILSGNVLYSQITLIVKNANDLPDSIKNNLYVAGNFNGWDPGDKKYKLTLTSQGYAVTFTPSKDLVDLEYKFTRGDWHRVEVNADGSQMQNRISHYTAGEKIEANIAGWDDLLADKLKEGNKNVIQFTLYSGQLQRDKNIRIYLPCDYQTSGQNYPVVYMLDGQNLFDDVYSVAGEWGIDETMDSLCRAHLQASIVVGIDHAGDQRLTEYSPWKIKKMDAGGEGDAFSQFVVQTLKPKIDSLYRTKKDRENTMIAGSSMGGLMSLYMVLNYNATFGKAAVFSPAFQTSEKNFSNATKYESSLPTQIYFIAGAKEGGDYEMMFNMQKMYNILLKKQIAALQMRCIVESEAQHTESFWRKEFFDAYMWLME